MSNSGVSYVKYDSLKDASDEFLAEVNKLESSVDKYANTANNVGESGEAWGGDAAESVVGVLAKIKNDISRLRSIGDKFNDQVKKTNVEMTNADIDANKKVTDITQSTK